MLNMIVKGGYQTPNHPQNKKDPEDMHEVKDKILSRIKKEFPFVRKVGKNPNIAIDDKTKTITLEGVGPYRGRNHKTDIPAEDFFVKISFIQETRKLGFYLIKPNAFLLPANLELITDTIVEQMLYGNSNQLHIVIQGKI